MTDAAASDKLEIQVIPTTVTSMAANMVLVKGETHCVMIDVPFSRADAFRVVAEILDSGKSLQTIFITHDHPDHFFGLDVLSDEFPDAAIVAHPVVARDLVRSVPIKFDRWSAMLGTNAPHRQVVPKPLESDEILLDGRVLKVIGPMQGDHVHSTGIWIEESRTLIAGDMAFNGVFPWLGEHGAPEYAAWFTTLDTIEAMKPARLIAGHTKPGLPDDSYAIAWTRQYIRRFIEIAKTAKSSGDMAATLYALYPNAIDVAGGFLVGVSSQVAVGEIPPWDE